MRRLFPVLMLLALLTAPAGRVAAAEPMAMPGHDAMAQSGHCNGAPMPGEPDEGTMTIDCLIACAVVAPPVAPALPIQLMVRLADQPAAVARFEGLSTGTDPPPPRAS